MSAISTLYHQRGVVSELIDTIEGILRHHRDLPRGLVESANAVCDAFEMDRVRQDNQSLSDFDSMNAETVGKEMAV